MTKHHYLFISRKSSHYKYYQKLVNFLGDTAELHAIKKFCISLSEFHPKVAELDLDDLVNVHMKRKEVRYPILKSQKWLNKLVRACYKKLEAQRANYYFHFLQAHPCTKVIVWNGMKQPNRTPYVVAKALGKETMLFENGLLPNTTTLDPKGVNAANSLPRDKAFYLSWQGEVTQQDPQLVVRRPHKQRQKDSETALPERYVFVPFQVPNDTQIVCHSPWLSSMEALYDALNEALQTLEKNAQWTPFKFVIKEHPTWPKNFTELYHKNPNIIFANGNNTQELIERSLAVITINSTVGIESLLLGKNVITLGNAFFNIDGLVHHCKNQEALTNALLTIEQQTVNDELVEKFLSYLKNEYLLPHSWRTTTHEAEHFAAVKARLENGYQP